MKKICLNGAVAQNPIRKLHRGSDLYEVMDFVFRKKEEYQFLNQKSVGFMSLCQVYILTHHLSRKADLVYF